VLYWCVIVFFGIILGDLFSGIFHWWEDRYGKTEWPIIGKFIIENNIGHHKAPWTIGNESYITNCGPAIIALLPFMLLSWYYGLYVLAIGFFVASQANQVHCWSHKKANVFIRFFQFYGLLLSPRHHTVHHKRPYTQRYCVVTDWLNPVLHATRFWNALEWLVWITLGVKTNPEREIY
jgi:ubiquitin-conjugating enzyme E2 variant